MGGKIMWFYRPPGATNYHQVWGGITPTPGPLGRGGGKTSPFPPRSARLPYGSRPSAWVFVSPCTKFWTYVQNRSNRRYPRTDWHRGMERPERRKTDSAGSTNIHTCAKRNEDLARGARVWVPSSKDNGSPGIQNGLGDQTHCHYPPGTMMFLWGCRRCQKLPSMSKLSDLLKASTPSERWEQAK